MSRSDIHFFLTMRNQIKMYHWLTKNYSRHKATDGAVEKLDTLIDSYVEICIGKYGRPTITNKSPIILEIQNLSDRGAVEFVRTCIDICGSLLVAKLDPKRDTDLLNLRDEIVGELNQLLYLFAQK